MIKINKMVQWVCAEQTNKMWSNNPETHSKRIRDK